MNRGITSESTGVLIWVQLVHYLSCVLSYYCVLSNSELSIVSPITSEQRVQSHCNLNRKLILAGEPYLFLKK